MILGGQYTEILSFNYEDYFVRHFNEFYVIHKDIDISDIKLQKEEVSDVRRQSS